MLLTFKAHWDHVVLTYNIMNKKINCLTVHSHSQSLSYHSSFSSPSVQRGPKSANKMKLIVLLSTIVLVSAKNIRIDQLEYGFCGELEIKQTNISKHKI